MSKGWIGRPYWRSQFETWWEEADPRLRGGLTQKQVAKVAWFRQEVNKRSHLHHENYLRAQP